LKYLLDTHAWIWLFEGSAELPAKTTQLLKDSANVPLGVSAISPWEVAKKSSVGKIRLSMPLREWVINSTVNPGIRIYPLTPEVAVESNFLPGTFHNDPADQMIVATARVFDLTIITCDRNILSYPYVRSFWK
jgi:PIN domain nuclease of toxin-antitoxin system